VRCLAEEEALATEISAKRSVGNPEREGPADRGPRAPGMTGGEETDGVPSPDGSRTRFEPAEEAVEVRRLPPVPGAGGDAGVEAQVARMARRAGRGGAPGEPPRRPGLAGAGPTEDRALDLHEGPSDGTDRGASGRDRSRSEDVRRSRRVLPFGVRRKRRALRWGRLHRGGQRAGAEVQGGRCLPGGGGRGGSGDGGGRYGRSARRSRRGEVHPGSGRHG